MARARNVKPSLLLNEVLGTADPLLTILFAGLWMLADREGRLEDRPARIKAQIFPYRDLPLFNGYLTELQQLGFIDRYEVEKQAIIQVLNFAKHQSPHKTEKPSELPAKPVTARVTCNAPLNNGSLTVKESLIPDSLIPDSLYLRDSDSGESPPAKSERSKPKTRVPENFMVTPELIAWVEENDYASIDLSTETDKFIDYWKSKGEAKADWRACWRTWIRNADRFQRESAGRAGGRAAISAAIHGN